MHVLEEYINLTYFCVRDSVKSGKYKHLFRKSGEIPYERLFYVRGGTITFTFKSNGKAVSLEAKKGDIIYLPKDAEYESYWNEESNIDYVTLLFELSYPNGELVKISDEISVLVSEKNEGFLVRFEQLFQIYKESKLGYKIKTQALFLEIIYDLIIIHMQNLSADKSVNATILFIQDHFLKDINVDLFAKQCWLSASAYRAKFKKITGMSPFEYRNYLRTKKAIEMLASREYKLNEIAEALAFSDVFYFCKIFKKIWGESPKKFMNSLPK